MTDETPTNEWHIFKGNVEAPHAEIDKLPDPPRWRDFKGNLTNAHEPPPLDKEDPEAYRGRKYQAGPEEVEMVNAALYLRRPLLVTGPPGAGKSSLAYAVAWELSLGPVLHWPITTRSTIQDGLYSYDAIGRLQESQMGKPPAGDDQGACKAPDVGRFIRLAPWARPSCPRSGPGCSSSTRSTRATSTCPTTSSMPSRKAGFPSTSWSGWERTRPPRFTPSRATPRT